MSYKKAKNFMKQFNLKNYKEFIKWLKENKCPRNMPRRPDLKYKDENFSFKEFYQLNHKL